MSALRPFFVTRARALVFRARGPQPGAADSGVKVMLKKRSCRLAEGRLASRLAVRCPSAANRRDTPCRARRASLLAGAGDPRLPLAPLPLVLHPALDLVAPHQEAFARSHHQRVVRNSCRTASTSRANSAVSRALSTSSSSTRCAVVCGVVTEGEPHQQDHEQPLHGVPPS